MKQTFNLPRSRKFICALLLVASGSAVVLAARWPRHAKSGLRTGTAAMPSTPTSNTGPNAIPSASPQTVQPSGPAQMVWFTVYDEGIRPVVAHASPGLVSIYLDDKSTHTASLIIADDRHPLGSINRGQGHSRGHSTISLAAGRYTIYEANRKGNSATLVVAP